MSPGSVCAARRQAGGEKATQVVVAAGCSEGRRGNVAGITIERCVGVREVSARVAVRQARGPNRGGEMLLMLR